MLVDSGVAINIVNKPHHRSIISRFPNFVAEYIKYGSDTKYNQVQFKIAVTQSTLEGQFNNGTLSTIIRYNFKKKFATPYSFFSFRRYCRFMYHIGYFFFGRNVWSFGSVQPQTYPWEVTD